ncbi:glycosyltransferase family 4 protein [Bacillus thuringiensis]|nr:glycosyltransferase family 4 protein [Bacillus thuringiensis]
MNSTFTPKNILMISHDYLPNIGGVAVYVHELSKALSQMGHKVTILTQYKTMSLKIEKSSFNQIRIFRVPISRFRKINDFQYVYRMCKLIKKIQDEEKVDIIHWHTLNKDSRVMQKIGFEGIEVYTNHLSWFRMLYNEGKYNKIYSLIKKNSHIICPSREIKRMSEELFGVEKTHYLPNGVDANLFLKDKNIRTDLRERYNIPIGDNVIISTNRMEPIKGMDFLINSIPNILKKCPNTTFLILGDGSQKNKLLRKVRLQNIDQTKVIFLGGIPNNEIREWMSIADVYVQPSLMEGCSISLIEAMACAKAIVATSVGGNVDVIHHQKSGLLIDPESSIQITEAVTDLLNSQKKRDNFGKKAREKVENELNWVVIAEKLTKIYDELKTSRLV